MKFAKDLKEVTVLGCRVRNSRIAEQQGKNRTKSRPQNHRREYCRRFGSIYSLHQNRDDKIGLRVFAGGNKVSPGYDANDREIDGKVNDCNGDNADDDGARYGPARVFYFVSDVTDVVVSKVIVNADSRRGAEPKKKAEREIESAWRKVERARGAKMQGSGNDDGKRGQQSANP